MPVIGVRMIDRNSEKLVRPFESSQIAAGMIFSHGNWIKNAGYSKEYENVFNWEEFLQTYLAWKAGYKLYALNEKVVWHLWDRSFRPLFAKDATNFSKEKQKSLNQSGKSQHYDNYIV